MTLFKCEPLFCGYHQDTSTAVERQYYNLGFPKLSLTTTLVSPPAGHEGSSSYLNQLPYVTAYTNKYNYVYSPWMSSDQTTDYGYLSSSETTSNDDTI